MTDNNVCRFVPAEIVGEDLTPLHFVLETKPQIFDKWRILAYYRMHFVISGTAVFRTQNAEYRLKKGDVFFCIPSLPYGIESGEDFKYYYVGFTGSRAPRIFDGIGIDEKNFIFQNVDISENVWENALSLRSEALKLYAEGLLLCVFGAIAARSGAYPSDDLSHETPKKIKKYVDENFGNPELTIQYLAKKFSYNTKYLSRVFKREFGINFSEYLSQIRIQNACALFDKGMESVQDVARLSGFSDPLYFSKVFKAFAGVSPKQHIGITKRQNPTSADRSE